MTAAMSAVARPGPKVLRVGLIENDAIVEERVIRERQTVSAGTTERCTFSVRGGAQFPERVELFAVTGDGYALRITPEMEGRVATSKGVRALADWTRDERARKDGDAWLLPLGEDARGKVTLRGVTFLFQFVPPPPVAPRPQLPASLKVSLAQRVDWRYNACFAGFLALAVSGLGWLEYGYDPVVQDDLAAFDEVMRRVSLAPETLPEPAPPEPEAVTEAAAVADNTARPTATPVATGPRGPTGRNHGGPRPQGGNNTQGTVDRANRAADVAAASVERELAAAWAPLTASGPSRRSAADMLQNNALLDGTEEDLRNTNSIVTARPGIARPTLAAANPNGPGGPGHRLGRTTTVSCATCSDGPLTGEVRVPTGPRTPPIARLPPEPEHSTCDDDARAVNRTMRAQLGGLRSCYERGLRNNPTLAGRVTMSFTLGTSGRATSVSASGLNPEVDTCLQNAVRRLVFAAPTCGAADFSFAVTFEPGQR